MISCNRRQLPHVIYHKTRPMEENRARNTAVDEFCRVRNFICRFYANRNGRLLGSIRINGFLDGRRPPPHNTI